MQARELTEAELTTLASIREALDAFEAGARHSKGDMAQLQSIHDAAIGLGASCPMEEHAREVEITGDLIPLREGAVGQDGTAFLKLIAPGWGSSGYYSESVLKRDGPQVFPKGTKNFWNHQTDAEEAARPEGDLRDLASVLTEDAHYEPAGPAGPGLYAKAEVQPSFRSPVDSLAKHIGMSIRASGKAKEGKAPDGKTGMIIERLTSGKSVDYVTTPGAGGKILQLFEAARAATTQPKESAVALTDQQEKELREAAAQGTTAIAIAKKLLAKEALREVADEYFSTIKVREGVRKFVDEQMAHRGVTYTEAGEVDRVALKTIVESETKRAVSLIESADPTGRVRGMGAPTNTQPSEAQIKEARAREEAALKSYGASREVKSKQGLRVLEKGIEAFDPYYNSAHNQEVA